MSNWTYQNRIVIALHQRLLCFCINDGSEHRAMPKSFLTQSEGGFYQFFWFGVEARLYHNFVTWMLGHSC